MNRKLGKKVAEVNKEIDDYSQAPPRQQRDKMCTSLDEQMRTGGKWARLKHLLDDSGNKSNQRCVLVKALHESKKLSREKELLYRLAKKYMPVRTTADEAANPVQKGIPNSALNETFTVSEIRRALHDVNGRSATARISSPTSTHKSRGRVDRFSRRFDKSHLE